MTIKNKIKKAIVYGLTILELGLFSGCGKKNPGHLLYNPEAYPKIDSVKTINNYGKNDGLTRIESFSEGNLVKTVMFWGENDTTWVYGKFYDQNGNLVRTEGDFDGDGSVDKIVKKHYNPKNQCYLTEEDNDADGTIDLSVRSDYISED